MGLEDLSTQEFEEIKKLLKILGVFGITEEDLRYLPEALKLVKNSSTIYKPQTISEKDKQKLEEKKQKTITPEEFFKQFETDIEEFYPNGKQ